MVADNPSANKLWAKLSLVTFLWLMLAFDGLAGGLTLDDQTLAARMASDVPWETAGPQQLHPLGLQTLSIEKQEQKNSRGTRLVRVYQYHYGFNAARLLVLDLVERRIFRQQSIDNIHLPLNDVEINHAKTLVARQDDIVRQLRAEQRLRNRPEFVRLSELAIKASIFEPIDPAHPCAKERCALLSLFDDTRTVFSIEPVVYLGTSQVGTLAQR